MNNRYCVYILTNFAKTVLYIGVTNNLARRLHEHKQELIEGFTQRYHCTILIYFEETASIKDAITRGKASKEMVTI